MIGSRLGQYEITKRLGAGGMGEVFQAADTRLGRNVAIKVLPEAFAQDASRLERFDREAKALAALNHPHIAGIYGIEEHDRRRFLVLELVDGETLAERLTRGSIAPDEAVRLALQIAGALEAAHEKGIIHRDLKPANIKINPEGNIKVLDFGLAKAVGGETANVSLSNSPTLSIQATGQGVILGTAAYMSPEQARGLPADRRADIWSFGCVFYEMLTGRQTFQGELVSDILASVLARDPDYTVLQANLHPRIREVLTRCLAKDPKKRWQAAGDVRVELELALVTPEQSVHAAEPISLSRKRRWIKPAAVAGVVVLAVLSAAAAWIIKPREARRVLRFSHILPEGQQFSGQTRPILAVSPDGSSIAYVANNQIYLRSVSELVAHPVAGTNEVLTPNSPFFSPDGQWIGYWAPSSQLKKIPIRGGTPAVLCAATSPFGASWAADGTILFGQADGIMRVSESGGNPELVVPTKPGEQAYGPELLPGGRVVLFSLAAGNGATRWDQALVVAHTLQSGERKVLTGGSDARYVPAGYLVYAIGNNLLAARFDADTLQLKSEPLQITSNLLRANSPAANTGAANYSFSSNGLFAHVVGTSAPANSLVWVDRNGRSEPVENLPRRRSYSYPRLSPDGRRIAVGESGDIWIYEIQRGAAIRLTRDAASLRPVWDPKGLQIAYTSSSSGTENIFVRPADGSGEARQLTKTKAQDHIDSWSPDGRSLFFHRHLRGSVDMYVLSLMDGQPTERVFLEQPSAEEGAQLSRDGKWAAYTSDESGRWEAYITPYPGPGGKTPVSNDGATQIVWTAGGELFYRTLDLARLMTARITTRPALQIGKPELAFEGVYESTVAPYANYDVTSDGQRILMILGDAQPGSAGASRPQINIVENWFEELRQVAPTR